MARFRANGVRSACMGVLRPTRLIGSYHPLIYKLKLKMQTSSVFGSLFTIHNSLLIKLSEAGRANHKADHSTRRAAGRHLHHDVPVLQTDSNEKQNHESRMRSAVEVNHEKALTRQRGRS